MRWLLLVLISFALSACVRVPSPRDHAVAPMAVLLRAEAVHHGVLDGSASMSEWVCLEAHRAGRGALVVELEDRSAIGSLHLRNRSGEVLGQARLGGGRAVTELFITVEGTRNARCVELRASKGLTVYTVRWRYR